MKTVHAKQVLLPGGWKTDIRIDIASDGTIARVGKQNAVCDQSVSLLLPAPTNLHSHTFQRAMSGLTEARGPVTGDNFWTWRKLMYRFLSQLNPDQIEAIATLAFMEMLEAGYAGVIEFHYLHHDQNGKPYSNPAELSERIVAAAKTSGIALTLLPVLYQYGGCDKRPLVGGQLRFGNDPDQFVKLHEKAAKAMANAPDDFRMGAAPHSLRAVDNAGLNAALAACPNGPIHMHLAEQLAEVSEFETHFSARPAEWLMDKFDINEHWTLIHCTQMNSAETGKLAKSGAIAGLCPITEANLGDGIFNGTQYMAEGGKIGVGSDSNIHISYFEELKSLEYSQRLRDHSRAALATEKYSSGRLLIEETLMGGAQASNRNSGAIEVGRFADMIGFDTDNQWLCGRQTDNCIDSLIFGGNGQSCITDVWSAGRHLVKRGRHHDRERIVRNYKNAIDALEHEI